MARPERAPQSEIDRILHALGEPKRREIIERLSERPRSVSALAEPLDITLTAVSQHLQLLERAGLVRTEKLGRVRSCRLEPGGLTKLERWISDRRLLWDKRLDDLADFLAAED